MIGEEAEKGMERRGVYCGLCVWEMEKRREG